MRPPIGLDEIIATFGDPHAPDFEAREIVVFDLPYPLVYGSAMVRRSRCHRLLVPEFQFVFGELKRLELVESATEYAGIYAQRNIRGKRFPSTHSWGIAVDMNPSENPLGQIGRQSPRVVEVFKSAGFTWGGEFKSRLDPMHFQFCRGY
jgi:hypothetical protein